MIPVHPDSIRQYNINAEIGHGSYGTVFKAFNKANRRAYAIKVYPKANLKTEEEEKLFQREVDAMAYVSHPGLVSLHDFFDDENNFYLVMDYCAGGELFDYIVKRDKLDEPTAALVFRQICSAVSYCHSFGIAHRDLKPENILVDKFPKIMITDFGLCGYLTDDALMKTFCGSPVYTAPELLLKKEYNGKKADIWSLGVILFGIVTGEHPWRTSNTSAMLSQIVHAEYTFPDYLSDGVKEIITNMLSLDPNERKPLDEVLKHKWFELAAKSPANNSLAGKRLLARQEPEAPNVSISTISEMSRDNSTIKFDHNIVSPFEEEDNLEEGTLRKTLPRLSVRSSSFANLFGNDKTAVKKTKSGNLAANQSLAQFPTPKKLFVSTGLSLAGNRQRSTINCLSVNQSTFG